jgi:endoglucanase
MKALVITAILFVFSVYASSSQGQARGWEQCGGIGWTGPTVCESGYTCIVHNPYYHQCLPAVID